MEPRDHLISQRLTRLVTQLKQGKPGALADFWEKVSSSGTPLIESIPGDCDHHWVTFLHRGKPGTRNVVVASSFTGHDPVCGQMRNLPDTDVWYRTWRLPADARATYQLSPNDPLVPMLHVEDLRTRTSTWDFDPLNPRKMVFPADTESGFSGRTLSVIELPMAPPLLWAAPCPPAAAGALEMHRFHSERLGNERRVWAHLPAGPRPNGQAPGLLVVLDGMTYVSALAAPAILDNLAAEGKIRPLVTLFVDALDQATRNREFACYVPFADFLAMELVPWAANRYRAGEDPSGNILCGPSHGGLAAAFTAATYPTVFGNVLAQSGSFWWSPEYPRDHEWLAQLLAMADRLPVRFRLEAGRLDRWRLREDDPTVLNATRHLRNVLRAKGYRADYHEFTGGHDYNCWQAAFPQAIMALAPPRR